MSERCWKLDVLPIETVISGSEGPATVRRGIHIQYPAEAESEIDPTLEPHGECLSRIFMGLEKLLVSMGKIPWAVSILDRDYSLVGHFCEIKGDTAELCFGPCRPPVPNRGQGGYVRVGMILVFSKSALGRVANRSPLFAAAWKSLADKSSAEHWLSFAGPLESKWTRRVEEVDVELYKLLRG